MTCASVALDFSRKRRHFPKALCSIGFLLAIIIFPGGACSALDEYRGVSISDVVLDDSGIPFILDSEGRVWSFRRPFDFQDIVQIKNLTDIATIRPYLAVDRRGRVYTWRLDLASSKWDDSDDLDAIFDAAKQVDEITSAKEVAASRSHFVAVATGGNVFEWGKAFAYGGRSTDLPLTKTFQTDSVIDISTSAFSTTILLSPTIVRGWGLNQRNQLGGAGIWVSPEAAASISFQGSAKRVYSTTQHTILLAADGNAYFFGGCNSSTDGKPDHIEGVRSEIQGISDIAVSSDDNAIPDVFLKGDGSVWLQYAPGPQDVHTTICGRYFGNSPQGSRIDGITGPAVKVAATDANVRFTIVALSADHTLWGASRFAPQIGFSKITVQIPSEKRD